MKKLLTLLMLGMFLFSVMTVTAREITCSDDGVVSVWHLDETSGTTASDECGINDGYVNGTESWVSGQYNNGLYVDGATFLNVGNDSSLSFGTGDFSIMLWFKVDGDGVLFDKYDGVTYDETYFEVSSNVLYLYFSDNIEYPEIIGTTNVSDGEWHLVTVVRDGENLSIYLDGVFEVGVNDTGIDNISTPAELWFGAGYSFNGLIPYADYFFNGTLDEISVFNKSLTQSEIDEYFAEAEEEVVETGIPANFIQGSGTLYNIIANAGAGLGLFILYMGLALPVLLIALALVGIIFAIGYAIADSLKNYFNK